MKKIFAACLLLLFISRYSFSQSEPEKEKVFIKNARQLIYEGKRSGEGYFSKDGKYLIFQSEREEENPFYQIYILNFETGDIHRVSPGTGKTTCSFFDPTGKRVLFASTHLDPDAVKKQQEELDFRASGKKRRYSWDYDTAMDIFSCNTDGKEMKRLTQAKGYDAEGSYSPDGRKIAFCSLRDAYNRKLSDEEAKTLEVDPAYFGEIYIMDADGSNQKRLTNTPGYDGGPFFSPDGKRIIWRRFTEDGMNADIYTMNLDGSEEKRLTDFHSMSWAPYFYPTGEYVIFASNKYGFGNFELFIVDKEGTKEPVRVTYTDGFDGLPVFSPDGKNLSWTSNRTNDHSSQVFFAAWDHEAALQALKDAPARGQDRNNPDFSPEIKSGELKMKVSFLASDDLEGRMTGSEGIKKAAGYITTQFTKLGLQPVGEQKSFLQEFPFISSVQVNESKTMFQTVSGKKKPKQWLLLDDYVPLSFSMNGELESEVVFAGYGIKTSDNAEVDYNSYANIDVKDKAVMVLFDMPGYLNDDEKKELVRYSNPRYKAMLARELGAKAIIFISERKDKFNGVSKDNVPGNSGILAIEIKTGVAEELLKPKNSSFEKIKAQYENYNPHAENEFALPEQKVKIMVQLDKQEASDNNIIGMVPAANPTDEYIMVGAHYDHLGRGEAGSLATGEEKNEIHNGADDNASGTAGVMELAEYFTQLKKMQPELFTKNLIFTLWSGEEMGLVGSAYFTQNPPVPVDKIESYLNFDMIGMLKDNKLILQGTGSSPEWKKIVEKKNVMAGFDLVMQADPYVPTDGMSLYQAKVPILCFFTGIHDHYHKPSDDTENLDFDGEERIVKFAAAVLQELMQSPEPEYAEVEMAKNREASQRGFTVYLGTVPDYVAEVEGVKLSGVRAGGPADKGGVKGGDIIIGLAGKDIKNIYDYTYILGDLQPNKEVVMVVLRNGKKLNLKVTPEAK